MDPNFLSTIANSLKESLKQTSSSLKPTMAEPGKPTPPAPTRTVEPEPMAPPFKADWGEILNIPSRVLGYLPSKTGQFESSLFFEQGGEIFKNTPGFEGLAPLATVGIGIAEPMGIAKRVSLFARGIPKAVSVAGEALSALKGVKESIPVIKQALPDASDDITLMLARRFAPITDADQITTNLAKVSELLKRNTEASTRLAPVVGIKQADLLRTSIKAGVDLGKVSTAIGKAAPSEAAQLVDDLRFSLTRVDPTIQKNAVEKLLEAMRASKPDIRAVAEAQSTERGVRIGKVTQALETDASEAGFKGAIGKLSGELTEKPTTPGIRAKLEQSDVDELFKMIKDNRTVLEYEKVTAANALWKLLRGELPVRSELSILEDIYGRAVIDAALDWRPMWKKTSELVLAGINLTKTFRSVIDFSAVLRQGLILTVSHPVYAKGAFKEMFRQTFSQKNFEEWLTELQKSPDWALIKKGDVYIANPMKRSGGLTDREEAFSSNLAEHIPVFRHLVAASERAYVGYLNKLRADVYLDLARQMQKEGVDGAVQLRALGAFINNATGRGTLGSFETAAQVLNTAFFSPRLIAARFNMLNPGWYIYTYSKSPFVAKQALKDMLITVGAISSLITVVKASGMAEVELDPRSTDFGKMKIGSVRIDPWGGFQQWVRFGTQIWTSQQKNSSKKIQDLDPDKYPFKITQDVLIDFFRGKLSPGVGTAWDYKMGGGENVIGEKQNILGKGKWEGEKEKGIYGLCAPGDVACGLFVPLYIEGLIEIHDELGASALLPPLAVTSMFGVGIQSHAKKSSGSSFGSGGFGGGGFGGKSGF